MTDETRNTDDSDATDGATDATPARPTHTSAGVFGIQLRTRRGHLPWVAVVLALAVAVFAAIGAAAAAVWLTGVVVGWNLRRRRTEPGVAEGA